MLVVKNVFPVLPSLRGCLFPAAPVTNFHKLGGLKPQNLILSQFRRPEVHSQYHWAKAGVGRTALPLEVREEDLFLSSSSIPWLPGSRACGHIIPAPAYSHTASSSVSQLPLHKDTCDYM